MRMTGYVRTYRGYDLHRDDDALGEGWYAVPSDLLPSPLGDGGGPEAEALAVYPDERSLRGDIDATFEASPSHHRGDET